MDKVKAKRRFKLVLSHGVCITLGAALMAFSLHMFILPAMFAPGGVSGLASIAQALWGFPAGYSIFILNVPLMILAFLFLGRRFSVQTLIAIALSSFFTELFRMVNLYEFHGDLLLAAVAGGVLTGVAIGLMVGVGASSGGTDIVGLLVQKRNSSLSISWLIFMSNAVVTLLAGILYLTVDKMDTTLAISIVLFSFISQYIESRAIEVVLSGFNSAVKFEVITNVPELLSQKIIAELGRGVTILESHGAYTNSPNHMIVCVVRRNQIAQFRKILKKTDPKAFAFATNTREVMGFGFSS